MLLERIYLIRLSLCFQPFQSVILIHSQLDRDESKPPPSPSNLAKTLQVFTDKHNAQKALEDCKAKDHSLGLRFIVRVVGMPDGRFCCPISRGEKVAKLRIGIKEAQNG